jgi:hypothetical protein
MQEDCKPRGYQTVRLVTDAERCAWFLKCYLPIWR